MEEARPDSGALQCSVPEHGRSAAAHFPLGQYGAVLRSADKPVGRRLRGRTPHRSITPMSSALEGDLIVPVIRHAYGGPVHLVGFTFRRTWTCRRRSVNRSCSVASPSSRRRRPDPAGTSLRPSTIPSDRGHNVISILQSSVASAAQRDRAHDRFLWWCGDPRQVGHNESSVKAVETTAVNLA